MRHRLRHLLCLLLLAALLAAENGQASVPGQSLSVGGAGSGEGALRRIAGLFRKQNPAVPVTILPGLGAAGTVRAVAAGRIDVGIAARRPTPEELGADVVSEPFGLTPLVFAVQASNPTPGLTLAEIESIYAGGRRAWPDERQIRLILHPRNDAFSLFLEGISPRMKAALEKARAIPGVFVGMTDQEVGEQIAKTPGSFGMLNTSLLADGRHGVRALGVDGVAPKIANIADGIDIASGKYPYVMTLCLVYRRDAAKSAVRDYVRLVFSPEGRRILSETGHRPLPRTPEP